MTRTMKIDGLEDEFGGDTERHATDRLEVERKVLVEQR